METTERSERSIALGEFSDVFKESRGFRPTGCLWPVMQTTKEIWALVDSLRDEIRAEIEEERYQEEKGYDSPTLFDIVYGDASF